MTPTSPVLPDAALESLLAFWADGGVDAMLLDAPIDRIEAGKFVPPPPPTRKPVVVAATARPGQLLDRMLAAAGLTDRAFITNTVFWRTPGNRSPTPEEQAICQPFLERAIALVQPKMLLLVGGASAKSLLKKDDGILSLRGRWFEWRSSAGDFELPAMPTLHPAFLLRQPAAKKRAWVDLMTLTERLDRPERPA